MTCFSLKLGKAAGHDTICHHMLKLTAHSLSKPLSFLFNMSLNQNIFPEILKKALYFLYSEKGDKHLVSHYRPITLLSYVRQVFERDVFKYRYNNFYDNSLFSLNTTSTYRNASYHMLLFRRKKNMSVLFFATFLRHLIEFGIGG